MNAQSNEFNQPIGEALENWSPPPLPKREPLLGNFCRLEPLNADQHASDLWRANSQAPTGAGWTYLPYGPFASEIEYVQWVKKVQDSSDPMFFAIITSEQNQAVGVASYLRIKPPQGSIEVGHIHFSPLLQRTPAATEAMFLMMSHAFDLGYRRYEWKCDALNSPSRAAAQRLGLSFEGVFRQATVYKGRNRDTAWYAAIDTQWPQLREAFTQWLDPENFNHDGRQRTKLSELTSPIVKSQSRRSVDELL